MSTFNKDSYNLLSEVKYIRNKDACNYDSNLGYEVIFAGDATYGWDTPMGMEAAGPIGSFYLGVSIGSICYVGRQFDFYPSFSTEEHWRFEMDLLLLPDKELIGHNIDSLTSRLQWKLSSDATWDPSNYIDFNVAADGQWRRYKTDELRSVTGWIGNCVNFRLYPFINGQENIWIYLRRMAFISPTLYRCKNPSCSYYYNYTHNCLGAGSFASATSIVPLTTSGFSITPSQCRIGIDIDNHGVEYIDLNESATTDGLSIALQLSIKLSQISTGGYTFAYCEFDESSRRFTIYTGTRGPEGSVRVVESRNDLAKILGFINTKGEVSYSEKFGNEIAVGFIEKYHKIPATTLYQLIDSTTPIISFNPMTPSTEIGRVDALLVSGDNYYWDGAGESKLLIDYMGKATYYGNIPTIIFNGYIVEGAARAVLLRPVSNNAFKVIGISELFHGVSNIDSTQLRSSIRNKFIVSVDWGLYPGDVVGLYRCMPAVGKTWLGGSNYFYESELRATWIEISVDSLYENQILTYTASDVKDYGQETLPLYGRSSETLSFLGFDIVLRAEYGLDSLTFIGSEKADICTYDIAKAFGTNVSAITAGSHTHWWNCANPDDSSSRHANEVYNVYALTDGIKTPLNMLTSWAQVDNPADNNTYFYLSSDMPFYGYAVAYDNKMHADTLLVEPFGGNGSYGSVGWCFGHDAVMAEEVLKYPWTTEERERAPFWITFTFSNRIKFYISAVVMYFAEESNLKDFCWEYYVDPTNWDNYTWTGHTRDWTEGGNRPAMGAGTEQGWVIFPDTTRAVIDSKYDVTSLSYFYNMYISRDLWDTYPNLTASEAQARGATGENLTWNSLRLEFPEIGVKKVRLFSWWHRSSKITEIEIYSTIYSVKSLVSALQLKVGSLDSSFHTGRYETTTISGIRVLSERTSILDDDSFIYYPTIEPTTTSGRVVAPLGITANKIEVEVGSLDVELCRILLTPQADAVRLTDSNTSPVTEVGDLTWQLIDESTDPIYSESKEYHVYNDSEELSTLRLNLAQTTALGNGLVYYCTLSGQEALDDPVIGPSPTLVKASDFDFTNINTIQHHAKVYTIDPISLEGARWFKKYDQSGWWEILEGAPFASGIYWNEKVNSESPSWSGANIFRTNKFDINTTYSERLAIQINHDLPSSYWNAPTYFTQVDKQTTCQIRTTFQSSLPTFSGADIFKGVVLYDQEDLTNYLFVALYSGNNITHPFGDYISYTCSGIKNYITIPSATYGVIPKIAKQGHQISLSYSNFSDPSVYLCHTDISDWSDNLRIGVFGDFVSISGVSLAPSFQNLTFNYLDYKESDITYTDQFNTYSEDFLNPLNCSNTFSGGNMHQSEFFYSTTTDDLIIKTTTSGSPYIWAPMGDQYSRVNLSFTLSDINFLGASGTHTFRLRVEDENHLNAWVTFDINANSTYITQTASGTVASGTLYVGAPIFVNLYKNGTDLTFDAMAGDSPYESIIHMGSYFTIGSPLLDFKVKLSIITNDSSLPSEVVINDLVFNFEDRTPNSPATVITGPENVWLACKLPQPAPVSEFLIYGKDNWTMDGYKEAQFSNEEYANIYNWGAPPGYVSWIRFTRSVATTTVGLTSIKIFPEPALAKIYNYPVNYTDITELKRDKLLSFCSNTESLPIGGLHTTDVSIDRFQYPVLILDLGKTWAVSNLQSVGIWGGTYSIFTGFPIMTPVAGRGKFATGDVDDPSEADWEYFYYDTFGLKRKCLYSVNGSCQLPSSIGLPKHPYYTVTPEEYMANGDFIDPDMPKLWFAFLPGGCDGLNTIQDTSTICPYFYSGRFRWWLLTSDDYNVTASGAIYPWHIDPLRSQSYDSIKLAGVEYWWESDTGTIDSSVENGENVITFSYEASDTLSFGINLEGCDLVRLTFDEDWVIDDLFNVDFKISNPSTVEAVVVRLGRDPESYWQFNITEDFSSNWSTFSASYKTAFMRGSLFRVFERYFVNTDRDKAISYKSPYLYSNFGYLEILIADSGPNQISFKNFKNKRCHYENTINNTPALFLGSKDLLLLPPLGITSTRGTIEFDWLPSEGPIGMSRGEQRAFILSLLTLRGSTGTGYSVSYRPVEGWSIHLFNPQTSYSITQRNNNLWSYYTAYEEQILINSKNPGPFHIVLSWDANGLPGLYSTMALWVNKVLVLSEANYLVSMYPSNSMSLILGKSLSNFQVKTSSLTAAYSSFANLKAYNYSVGTPTTLLSAGRKPEDFLQMSLDNGNWADLTNGLPLIVKNVPAGEAVSFYTRAKHFDKQTAAEFLRRTGYIVVEWSYD